jgi:hypothetical protein
MQPLFSTLYWAGFCTELLLGTPVVGWLAEAQTPVPQQESSPTTPAAPAPLQLSPPSAEASVSLSKQAGAPVMLNGKGLFYIRERTGSFPPIERAEAVTRRLEDLAFNPFREEIDIAVVDSETATDITADETILLTVTDRDATANGKPRQQLAEERAAAIQQALVEARKIYNVRTIAVLSASNKG